MLYVLVLHLFRQVVDRGAVEIYQCFFWRARSSLVRMLPRPGVISRSARDFVPWWDHDRLGPGYLSQNAIITMSRYKIRTTESCQGHPLQRCELRHDVDRLKRVCAVGERKSTGLVRKTYKWEPNPGRRIEGLQHFVLLVFRSKSVQGAKCCDLMHTYHFEGYEGSLARWRPRCVSVPWCLDASGSRT